MHGYNFERFANYGELRDKKQYIVKVGDSLYSIAKLFDVSVNDIMTLNKLSSTMIYPNQILFIPDVKNGFEYITKTKDTIGNLYKTTGFTPTEFVECEEIMNLQVLPNQVVKMKTKSRDSFHEVSENDDISSILKRYNLDLDAFVNLNCSSWLKVGNKIRIN